MNDLNQLIFELTVEGFNLSEIEAMLKNEYGFPISVALIKQGMDEALKEMNE